MDCTVCCEPIKNEIKCKACDHVTCLPCQKKYLTSIVKVRDKVTHQEPVAHTVMPQDPHCMSCKTAWNKSTLYNTFPRGFVDGDLKRHRQQVIFEREQVRNKGTHRRRSVSPE